MYYLIILDIHVIPIITQVQSVGEMLRMMVVYKCLPKDQVRLRAYLLEGDVEKQIEFKGNIPLFIEEQMDELANDLDGSTKMKLLWWD